jgi:hypothetical protein
MMFLRFIVSVVGGSAVAAVLLGGVLKILQSMQTKQSESPAVKALAR